MNGQQSDKIQEIKSYIDKDLCSIRCVGDIINRFKISNQTLNEQFRYCFSISPKQYILNKKFDLLIKMIEDPVIEDYACNYAFRLGFRSSSALYNFIKNRTGLSFNEFRTKVNKKNELNF